MKGLKSHCSVRGPFTSLSITTTNGLLEKTSLAVTVGADCNLRCITILPCLIATHREFIGYPRPILLIKCFALDAVASCYRQSVQLASRMLVPSQNKAQLGTIGQRCGQGTRQLSTVCPPLGCGLRKRRSTPLIHRPMYPLVEMRLLSTSHKYLNALQ